jgi:murein DD-endopeptidase MepM/ murein hydrolase activator NlpD
MRASANTARVAWRLFLRVSTVERRVSLLAPLVALLASAPALAQQHVRARWTDDSKPAVRPRRSLPWPARGRVGIRIAALDDPIGPLANDATATGPRRDPPITRAALRDLGLRPRGLALTDIGRWPAEPASPDKLEGSKLAAALVPFCDLSVSADQRQRYARWILRYSSEFGVDPMLVAAVIAQQSRCLAQLHNSYGIGLGMINPHMYRRSLRKGSYSYGVRDAQRWRPQRLALERFSFSRANLLAAEPNIYFTAAFLSVWKRQCPDLDRAPRSAPHRHFVAHYVWGDHVHDAGVEDRILTVRRQLLERYRGKPYMAGRAEVAGVALDCPLDGAPRKITGVIGDDRDFGRRRHTGIDFDSTRGEPVRAVADGTVILAGVDWGGNYLGNLNPHLTAMVRPERMGPRGLLIKIEHQNKLVSIYMHLSAYSVWPGQYVTRGQLIGYVGRTGIKQSPPHLHFELWHRGVLVDPLEALTPYLFGPQETYRGRRVATLQQRRRTQRRDAGRKRRHPRLEPADPFSVP